MALGAIAVAALGAIAVVARGVASAAMCAATSSQHTERSSGVRVLVALVALAASGSGSSDSSSSNSSTQQQQQHTAARLGTRRCSRLAILRREALNLPNPSYVTATLRHLGALGASYPAWYDSALGGAN